MSRTKRGGDLPMEGVIYPLGGGDLPHQNTSPRAPVGAKKGSIDKLDSDRRTNNKYLHSYSSFWRYENMIFRMNAPPVFCVLSTPKYKPDWLNFLLPV